MSSPKQVHLPQVELVVKDTLRKQSHLKIDKTLAKNSIVGILRKPGASVSDDAARLMAAFKLGPSDLRGT
jgi:hypothetical protein